MFDSCLLNSSGQTLLIPVSSHLNKQYVATFYHRQVWPRPLPWLTSLTSPSKPGPPQPLQPTARPKAQFPRLILMSAEAFLSPDNHLAPYPDKVSAPLRNLAAGLHPSGLQGPYLPSSKTKERAQSQRQGHLGFNGQQGLTCQKQVLEQHPTTCVRRQAGHGGCACCRAGGGYQVGD